ncbi:hypothetical protein GF402_01315 [Candidatus Fermentibacteria bacterium]|nr:hypothetical protein [Candidatus Fermentibacteria bacterium]
MMSFSYISKRHSPEIPAGKYCTKPFQHYSKTIRDWLSAPLRYLDPHWHRPALFVSSLRPEDNQDHPRKEYSKRKGPAVSIAQPTRSEQRHVLVTGIHRSGTTFVGAVLANVPGMGYVQEPFNPDLGMQGIETWYPYVRSGMPGEGRYARLVERLLAGKARYKKRPGRHGGILRWVGRKLFGSRDYLQYLMSTRFFGSKRLVLKDPIVSLASEWLHRRFGMKVLVLMRHPAGFAASTARLGWDFDFSNLTSQRPLMDDYLGEILRPLDAKSMAHHERAGLLWRCIYTILEEFIRRNPEMKMMKLEEISKQPLSAFEEIHRFLGLPLTDSTKKLIADSTSPKNPPDAPDGQPHSLKRNSRSLVESWKRSLDPQNIERIMELAGPLARKYYPRGTGE